MRCFADKTFTLPLCQTSCNRRRQHLQMRPLIGFTQFCLFYPIYPIIKISSCHTQFYQHFSFRISPSIFAFWHPYRYHSLPSSIQIIVACTPLHLPRIWNDHFNAKSVFLVWNLFSLDLHYSHFSSRAFFFIAQLLQCSQTVFRSKIV